MPNRMISDAFALSDAQLLERDEMHDAAQTLTDIYRELAPAEALTRALVSERTGERQRAVFWALVFSRCVERESP